jgi:DNA-binding transcriptional regulator GbsR (MarR family)
MEQAKQDFIESMGRHFEQEGAPRIAGRLFGLLMLNEEPCSLDEIAELLQASKGSASTNARLLERLGVAERVSRPADRRDYYQVADDMGERMLALALERMEQMLQRLRRGAETIALPTRVERRFAETIRFHVRARETVEGALARLRACADNDDDETGRGTAPEER